MQAADRAGRLAEVQIWYSKRYFNYAVVQEQLASAFKQIHNQHVLSQRQLLNASKRPPTRTLTRTHTHTTLLNTHPLHFAFVM